MESASELQPLSIDLTKKTNRNPGDAFALCTAQGTIHKNQAHSQQSKGTPEPGSYQSRFAMTKILAPNPTSLLPK